MDIASAIFFSGYGPTYHRECTKKYLFYSDTLHIKMATLPWGCFCYLPIRLLSQSQTAVKPRPEQLLDYFRHSIENCTKRDLKLAVILTITLYHWLFTLCGSQGADLHGTTLSHSTSLRQACDMTQGQVHLQFSLTACQNRVQFHSAFCLASLWRQLGRTSFSLQNDLNFSVSYSVKVFCSAVTCQQQLRPPF